MAIAEASTISKAAQRLCIAQPPLSRQLKMIEEEVGAVLFERGKAKHLAITPQGELFLSKARALLRQLDESLLQVRELNQQVGGRLSIGSAILCSDILLTLLQRYQRDYPEVHFSLWEGGSNFLAEQLGNHQIEMGIVAEPFDSRRFDSLPLETLNCVVAAAPQYDLPPQLSLAQLAELPLLLLKPTTGNGLFHRILNTFAEQHLTPNIVCECHDSSMLLNLMEMGLGVAVLPEVMLRKNVHFSYRTFQVEGESWQIQPYLLWRKNSYLSNAARAFLQLARKTIL
ncbi:LysR family transcriptional regulator [Neisseria perflava]|uniref:LysR family transcriptional regulator n=1 Tax=Neisseria perflava TaxID=33053 RepID=UPI00345F90EE